MSFKKGMLLTMMGGMMVYGYMKYKDGTMSRAIKNMKPMMESMMENLKK